MFDIDPHSYTSPHNNSMCWVPKVKANVTLISFDSSKIVTTALLMTHRDLRFFIQSLNMYAQLCTFS